MGFKKMVVLLIGVESDDQLKRLFRFLDKHGIEIFTVEDVDDVRLFLNSKRE